MYNKVLQMFDANLGFWINSNKVLDSDSRLDPSHYTNHSGKKLNDRIKFKRLGDFVESIIEPNLFTRYYCAKEFGIPYISSSEMSEIEPPINSRFISKELTNDIAQYIISRGQILVSAAGTVGSVVVAPKLLNGVAGTSDILRINVDPNKYLGFIYTYLTSAYGITELTNLAYGAIIKRVRGFQLEELKTPVIDAASVSKINDLILSSLNKRDEANELISKARALVLKYNNLPTLDEIEIDTIDPNKEVEIRLASSNEFTNEYRLDANFYSPIAQTAVKNIFHFAKKNIQLGEKEITKRIFYLNRFTRTFVTEDFGIPYIAGKDIIKIRPYDVSYLSKTETSSLNDYKLEKGWILMTCSGTLARTCYIWRNYEDWVGTHDLIRIVCSENFDSGYLFAFLSSPYGYYQAIRYKHGAVIDHLTSDQIEEIVIPIPDTLQMIEIGDLVRKAYDLRAEAIQIEDEAQKILTEALTGK